MPGAAGGLVLCLAALLALMVRPAAPTHTLGRMNGSTAREREGHRLADRLTACWADRSRVGQAPPRLSLDRLPEVSPWSAVAFSLTNRLFARVATEGGDAEPHEVALLRLSQGLDPRGLEPKARPRLTPPPLLTDLALEARAQPTSTLSVWAKAVYEHREGRFGPASAALTLQPLPRLTLALEPHLPSLSSLAGVTGRLGLDLAGGWHLRYAVGAHAPAPAGADQTLTVQYGSAFGSVGVQLAQGPEGTRVALQLSLRSLPPPTLVRTRAVYHHQRTYTRFAHAHVLAAHGMVDLTTPLCPGAACRGIRLP